MPLYHTPEGDEALIKHIATILTLDESLGRQTIIREKLPAWMVRRLAKMGYCIYYTSKAPDDLNGDTRIFMPPIPAA